MIIIVYIVSFKLHREKDNKTNIFRAVVGHGKCKKVASVVHEFLNSTFSARFGKKNLCETRGMRHELGPEQVDVGCGHIDIVELRVRAYTHAESYTNIHTPRM